MAGNIDAARSGRGRPPSASSRRKSSRPGPPRASCSSRRPPGRPGASTTPAVGRARASRRRARARTRTHLARLLSLAATVANLRGEYAKAAAYQAEIERLTPAGGRGRGRAPARRDARRRRRQPDRGDRARPLRNQRGAGGPRQRLRTAGDHGPSGQPRPGALREVDLRGKRSGRPTPPAPRGRLLGRDASDRGGRQGFARALDPALEGPDARGLRRRPRRRRARRRKGGGRRGDFRSLRPGDRYSPLGPSSDLPVAPDRSAAPPSSRRPRRELRRSARGRSRWPSTTRIA